MDPHLSTGTIFDFLLKNKSLVQFGEEYLFWSSRYYGRSGTSVWLSFATTNCLGIGSTKGSTPYPQVAEQTAEDLHPILFVEYKLIDNVVVMRKDRRKIM